MKYEAIRQRILESECLVDLTYLMMMNECLLGPDDNDAKYVFPSTQNDCELKLLLDAVILCFIDRSMGSLNFQQLIFVSFVHV